MLQLREHPYIWATWLPRLMTGDRSCEWAIWFKAHHQGWTRQPSDFDQSQWMLEHTALLHQQKAEWEQRGYDVYIEAQNSFRLRGRTATLAGRPDLIVDRGDDALIIDAKTGREQSWHNVQVQIYQHALPKALPERFRHARIAGEVVYPSGIARVPRGALPHAIVAVCRDKGVRYSITVRQHQSLRNFIEAIPETDWTPISYWMEGAADVAETEYTPFGSEPDAVPVRFIVRRVKPTPGSQLALFANYSYHAFITDRDAETLDLEAAPVYQ